MRRLSIWLFLACGTACASIAAAPSARSAAGPARAGRPIARPQGHVVLSAAEVAAVVERAALTAAGDGMAIVVVDRRGAVLAAWRRPGATPEDEERALSLARTGAFFANDQAPLSSRTVRFISGVHFPPGVRNQPSGALYGIEITNRVHYNVAFNAGKEFPPPLNLDGTGPSLGITTGKVDVFDSEPHAVNPGGFPIYKDGKVAGGIGVAGVGTRANKFREAEFAAFRATQLSDTIRFPFPLNAAIFIDGIKLPFVSDTVLQEVLKGRQLPGIPPGTYDPAFYTRGPQDGMPAADGLLAGLSSSPELSLAEVETILQQSIRSAERTRAAIRLPRGSRARMVIAIGDLQGNILALHRMQDSTIFSLDVAVAKARNVVYFSGPDRLPEELPGLPVGTAVTNRTLSFGAQPLFLPGLGGTESGPFFHLYQFDREHPGTQGRQPPNPNQNGIVFFPGSVPLYKNGRLVGGLGISGDGVEQDDFVAFQGARGYHAPRRIRADRYRIRGVRMPYLKFPRNPLR